MIDRSVYEARIGCANPVQLVVINFELIIDAINDALEELGKAEPDQELCSSHIAQASNCLEELIRSLNFEISLSSEFHDIYRYANQKLLYSYYSPKQGELLEVLNLMNILHEGWKQAEDQSLNMSENVSANISQPMPAGKAPVVYAGLTYGRGGLEEYHAESESAGFKA